MNSIKTKIKLNNYQFIKRFTTETNYSNKLTEKQQTNQQQQQQQQQAYQQQQLAYQQQQQAYQQQQQTYPQQQQQHQQQQHPYQQQQQTPQHYQYHQHYLQSQPYQQHYQQQPYQQPYYSQNSNHQSSHVNQFNQHQQHNNFNPNQNSNQSSSSSSSNTQFQKNNPTNSFNKFQNNKPNPTHTNTNITNLQLIKKRKDEEKKLRRIGILPHHHNANFKNNNDPNHQINFNNKSSRQNDKNYQNNSFDQSSLTKPKKTHSVHLKKELAIPSAITVSQLAQLTRQKLYRLQSLMQSAGLLDTRPDRILSTDDTAYLVLESGFEPIVNDGLAYDVYPDPVQTEDRSKLPLRPPVVCIMGHVDHGKTTLLDSLRNSSVAESEAGGITQHIGAFEVSLNDLMQIHQKKKKNTELKAIHQKQGGGPQTITFLDTPGHAAFSAMRSRGAMTTDVAVIVVAGDDGVKPQTKEVIELVKQTDIGIVIAITKCDKPGIDLHRTKASIYDAGIEVEGLGGEVPCVEVSAITGKGLPELAETILAVAEVRDLRAEEDGVRFEGRVIESDIEHGHGNTASVITLRGDLHVGLDIIAGRSYGRVRQLISVSGESISKISPGRPVKVTGWKNLPEAGSLVLGVESEEQAKRAYENRVRRFEEIDLAEQIEAVNEKRALAKEAFETNKSQVKGMTRRERLTHIREKNQKELAQAKANSRAEDESPRKLRVVLKADYTGTAEAVKTAIEGLGNDQVNVQIISSGVGNITESDVQMAVASNSSIVGFNVKIDPMAHSPIEKHKISCSIESVIYRLVDQITNKLIDLLPKRFKQRVIGEAKILQIFEVNNSSGSKQISGNKKSHVKSKVAGCKVTNGEIKKNCLVKILRNEQVIWSGLIKDLKQGKKETNSVQKGNEFGISFKENPNPDQDSELKDEKSNTLLNDNASSSDNSPSIISFDQFQIDDLIIASDLVPIQRALNDGL